MARVRLPVYAADDVAVATDPRGANVNPYTSEDQTDKLQWFLDSVCHRSLGGKPPAGYLPPGVYRKSDELILDPTDGHRPPTIWGAGHWVNSDAPTVIIDTADAGAGKYTLRRGGHTASTYEVYGISFYALSPTLTPKGHPGWQMGGVFCNGRGAVHDLCVFGYQNAIALTGDHHNIWNIIGQGNVKGLELPPGSTSQGDIVVRKCQFDGCSQAGIAIAEGCQLGGFRFLDGAIGVAPFGIWRYPVDGAPFISNWITGAHFEWVATEFIGNGVLYDEVQDGSGITNIDWIGNSIDWALGNDGNDWGYNSETKPKLAAWYNGGPIRSFRVQQGFPTFNSTRPAFMGTQIDVDAPNSGGSQLPGIIAGARPFELLPGGSAQHIAGTKMGTVAGSRNTVLFAYRMGTGTIDRGQWLTNYQETAAQKGTNPTTQRCIGVATRTCDTAGTTGPKEAMALMTGHNSDTKVLNTSGITIPANSLIKPHASGGFQAATGHNDGQVCGRMTYDCLTAQLQQAELWIASS